MPPTHRSTFLRSTVLRSTFFRSTVLRGRACTSQIRRLHPSTAKTLQLPLHPHNPCFHHHSLLNYQPTTTHRSKQSWALRPRDPAIDKKQLSETDIRTKFITPAILGPSEKKWDLMTQIRDSSHGPAVGNRGDKRTQCSRSVQPGGTTKIVLSRHCLDSLSGCTSLDFHHQNC